MYKNYVETYLQELKNGKQIRIKYNEPNYDYCDPAGWWKEELWSYDNEIKQFKCYYPVSTYDKDFFTTCNNEELMKFVLKEDINDHNDDEDEQIITDIIVEDCGVPNGSLSLREAVIERIKTMSDDEIRQRIFL